MATSTQAIMSSTTKEECTTKDEWPNLVEESGGLLLNSIFMYALPDLQSLAEKKILKDGDAEKALTFPIKTVDLLNFCMKYQSELKAHFNPGDLKLYGTALFLAKEYIEKMGNAKQAIMASEIVFFDAKDSKSELVYGIAKDDIEKKVTVMFRGTATLKELQVDADGFIVDCDNPLNPESKEKIGVHKGFRDYLNGAPPKGHGGGTNLNAVNKYSEIMSELTVVFKGCPGYRLYVTGHSLGASLAQLFAMEAAASTDEFIPKPVTTINFASPKVGDVYFRNCFEDLEDQGKLRCLRFCNDADIIPTLPDRQNCSCFRNLRCKPSVYRHAGPSLILHPGQFEIRYEKRDKETKLKFMQEAAVTSGHGVGFAAMVPTLLRYEKNFLTNHSCGEYMKRFHEFSTKCGGDKIFLNHIYKNQAALEKLLEEGFQEKSKDE